MAKVGDGTFSDEGVSTIVVSVIAVIIILSLLAGLLYCFRKKKGKTAHGKSFEMKNAEGPPTPKMRKHHEFKND